MVGMLIKLGAPLVLNDLADLVEVSRCDLDQMIGAICWRLETGVVNEASRE
jgi:hypothetical protein